MLTIRSVLGMLGAHGLFLLVSRYLVGFSYDRKNQLELICHAYRIDEIFLNIFACF